MTRSEQWQASSPTGNGRKARQKPEDTVERRITLWQRALRWIAWPTFLGLAIWKSNSVYFSPIEWPALIAAIAISIWCMAKPLGGPKYELREPTHLLSAKFFRRLLTGRGFTIRVRHPVVVSPHAE